MAGDATSGVRGTLGTAGSEDTPSSLHNLTPWVRERLDAITPIGRDEYGNFLFNAADQVVVNRLISVGATVDRNGRVTGIPQGVDISRVLEEEESPIEDLCWGVAPRTFAVLVVFTAVIIGLIAIVGTVVAVAMDQRGGGGGGNEPVTGRGVTGSSTTPLPTLLPTLSPTTLLGRGSGSLPPNIGAPPLRPTENPTSIPDDINCTSLCFDGSQVLFPDRIIGRESGNGRDLTCGDVEERFDEFAQRNGCTFMQVRGAALCGCRGPPPPEALCWICHDGAPLPPERLDTVVFFPETTAGTVTCGDIAVNLGTDTTKTDDFCFKAQIWGSLACGCSAPHPEAKCWICPDGSIPSAISSNDEALRATCINQSETIARIDNEEICREQVAFWGPRCGCQPNEPSSMPTSLPTSLAPTKTPSFPPSVAPTTAPSNTPSDALSLAPTEAPSTRPSIGFNDDVTCRTLCADGSPVPFPERFFKVDSGRNQTCGEVESNFAFFANQDGCRRLQSTAAIRCGCPGGRPPPEIISCWICQDNSSLTMEQFDQVALVNDGGARTCAWVAESINNLDLTHPSCFTGQLVGTLSCGCPSPYPPATCWMCPDGSVPAALSGSDPLLRKTCREQAELMARIKDETECQELIDIWAPECGCELPSPPPSAQPSELLSSSPTQTPLDTSCTTLCPDGSPVGFPDRIAGNDPLTGRPITCAEVELDVSRYIENSGCLLVHATGIAQCGCPGPPPKETLCWLCHDNTTVTELQENADTVVALGDDGSELTCGSMAVDLAADRTNPEEVCLIAQVIGSLTCGCPSPHPLAKCWICPDGGPMAPSDGVRNVCLEAADEITRIDDEERCQQQVNAWASLCGCGGIGNSGGDGDETGVATSSPSLAPSTSFPTTTTPKPTDMSLLLESMAPSTMLSSTPTATGTFTTCGGLCADGSRVPFPDFVAVPSESPNVDPTTCRLLEDGLDQLVASNVATGGVGVADEFCFWGQVIGSYRCGCIAPHPRATCWFTCPGGRSLPQDRLDTVVAVDTSGNPITCMNLAFAAKSYNEEDCAEVLTRFSDGCCGET